jgi:hypothetical protein
LEGFILYSGFPALVFFSLYLLTVVGSVVNGVPLSPFLFISVRFLSERAIDLLVELIFIFVSLYYSRDGSFWDFIKGCSDAGKKRGQAQLPENWFFLGFLSLIFFTF